MAVYTPYLPALYYIHVNVQFRDFHCANIGYFIFACYCECGDVSLRACSYDYIAVLTHTHTHTYFSLRMTLLFVCI